MASFWKPEACGQSVLPDRSVLIGPKLVENAKIKCDILSNFQTMCKTCRIAKQRQLEQQENEDVEARTAWARV